MSLNRISALFFSYKSAALTIASLRVINDLLQVKSKEQKKIIISARMTDMSQFSFQGLLSHNHFRIWYRKRI